MPRFRNQPCDQVARNATANRIRRNNKMNYRCPILRNSK
jgi:hypothetical protein